MTLPPFGALFPGAVAVHAMRFADGLGAGHPPPPPVAAAAPGRRAEFIAGRICAGEALRRAGGRGDDEVGVGPLRAPSWPAGFTGSITHACGIAVAAVAPTTAVRALGIDLEAVVPSDRVGELAPLVLRADELARATGSRGDASAAFTAVFAAKEALFKALAPMVGRYFDFHDAEVVDVNDERVRLRLRVDLDGTWRAGAALDVKVARLGELVFAALVIEPAARPAVTG